MPPDDKLPHLDPLEPDLDFHPSSASANFEWFQRVCADILRRHPDFTDVEPVGVAGEAQEGLDIRATHLPSDAPWGFQCKQERDFGPQEVTRAINAVPAEPGYKAAQYRILLSRVPTDGAVQRARATQGWDIWGSDTLSRLVQELPPDEAVKLVHTYWGPYWVERFLDVEIATTFATPRKYFRPYIDRSALFGHDRPLRGRDDALSALRQWEQATSKVAVVAGPLGIGRSKLLYEFANVATASIAMPLPAHDVNVNALNEIGAGSVILAVDDADQRDLGALLAYAARDEDKRLLLTCLPSSEEKLRDAIIVAGIRPAEIHNLSLRRVDRDATIAISRDVEPKINDDVAEHIVMTASDTPLATIAAVRLSTAGSVEQAGAVFSEVTALFRPIIEGRVADLPRDKVRLALALVAAIGPVRFGGGGLAEAAQSLGIPPDELAQLIAELVSVGALATLGDKINVSPTPLRDAILIDACASGSGVTPFVSQLYETLGFSKSLFRNLALADSTAKALGSPSFFDGLWRKAQDDAIAFDNARRREFVCALPEMAALKPSDVIRTLRALHRNPPANDTQQFEAFFRVSAAQVDEEMPKALRPILEWVPRYAKPCVEFLWELAASDGRLLNSNPGAAMRVLQDAAGYDETPIEVKVAIIDAVAGLLARTDLDERLYTPLDIIAPTLSLGGHRARSRGEQLFFGSYSVAVSRVSALRDRALDLCVHEMLHGTDRRSLSAMKIAGSLLSGIWNAPIEGEDLERLREEQNRVLDAFEGVARDGNVLRRAFLRNELATYARRQDALGKRIEVVLDRLPVDKDMRFVRVLAPELERNWRFAEGEDAGAALNALMAQVADDNRQAAIDSLSDYPDDVQLSTQIEEICQRVRLAGLSCSPGALLGEIAAVDLERAEKIVRASLVESDMENIRLGLGPVLYVALQRGNEADLGLLMDAARDTKDEVRVSAAAAVRAPLRSYDAASLEAQQRFASLIELLADSSSRVRETAAQSARFFLAKIPELAIPMIEAFHGDDGTVLESLFASIPRPPGAGNLRDATYRTIVNRLKLVDQLEYFEVMFMADGCARNIESVLDVLNARLRHDGGKGYRAVPHDPTLQPLVDAIVSNGAIEQVLSLAVHAFTLSPMHEYDAREIVRRVFAKSPEDTRSAIGRIGASCGANELPAIAHLAASAPEAVSAEDVSVYTQLIERAFAINVQTGNNVGRELTLALFSGPRMRQGRENSAVLLRLRESVTAALQRAEPASEAEAFFEDVAQRVNREIEEESKGDDGAYGPA